MSDLLTPLPDLRRTEALLDRLVTSACSEPSSATLLFVADVLATRQDAYEAMLAERRASVDELLQVEPLGRSHPEYRRRLRSAAVASKLLRSVDTSRARLMEHLV